MFYMLQQCKRDIVSGVYQSAVITRRCAVCTTRGRNSSTAVHWSFPTAETEKPSVLSFLGVKTVFGFHLLCFCVLQVYQERFMTPSTAGGAMGGGVNTVSPLSLLSLSPFLQIFFCSSYSVQEFQNLVLN